MQRLLLAVAAGFLSMWLLIIGTQALLWKLMFGSPGAGLELGHMPPAFLLASCASDLVYAVIGGCITAAIGRKFEAPTVLGALLLGMGIGGVVMNRGGQPVWYQAVVAVMGAAAATIAGYKWLGRQPPEEKNERY